MIGGFLYTNKDTLSLGVVVKINSLYNSKRQPHEVLDEFKSHPFIARLIRGGEVVEYSAQTVHRGGFHLIPQLYGHGYVVAGSAARLLLNNVMTLPDGARIMVLAPIVLAAFSNGVRGGLLTAVAACLGDAVRTMAVAATRRIDQPGQEQRLAVHAGQVAVHEAGRLVMAATAVLDLVDNKAIHEIAPQVKAKLEKVRDLLVA